MTKFLERLVARQLMEYMSSTGAYPLPALQSGFRPGYSTETAVLRVLSDILLAVDRGDLDTLILLDLTAARGPRYPATTPESDLRYQRRRSDHTWSEGTARRPKFI